MAIVDDLAEGVWLDQARFSGALTRLSAAVKMPHGLIPDWLTGRDGTHRTKNLRHRGFVQFGTTAPLVNSVAYLWGRGPADDFDEVGRDRAQGYFFFDAETWSVKCSASGTTSTAAIGRALYD